MSEELLLDVQDLRTHFFTRRGVGKAVDGVSFSLRKGQTLGLVGESACGKSITSLSLLRLVPQPAGKIVGGTDLLRTNFTVEGVFRGIEQKSPVGLIPHKSSYIVVVSWTKINRFLG